ncbi:hypothetical protein XAC908_300001 [Xanthomonas citri pv. citri]|nr:hypothetical protein XAC908_300001 [Xanthomonas citri pv. citri]
MVRKHGTGGLRGVFQGRLFTTPCKGRNAAGELPALSAGCLSSRGTYPKSASVPLSSHFPIMG